MHVSGKTYTILSSATILRYNDNTQSVVEEMNTLLVAFLKGKGIDYSDPSLVLTSKQEIALLDELCDSSAFAGTDLERMATKLSNEEMMRAGDVAGRGSPIDCVFQCYLPDDAQDCIIEINGESFVCKKADLME